MSFTAEIKTLAHSGQETKNWKISAPTGNQSSVLKVIRIGHNMNTNFHIHIDNETGFTYFNLHFSNNLWQDTRFWTSTVMHTKIGILRQESIWRHSPFWALALPQNMPPFYSIPSSSPPSSYSYQL
jgi:hypothetical protein